MTYIPHTDDDRQQMLARIGVASVEELFSDIPQALRFPHIDLPDPVSEPEVLEELRALAALNANAQESPCFLGAGAYHHFIPSVVNHVLLRSEFYTAYTPYQPEISQGTLQAMFEYQSMICALTGMEVSNASHYDGASALAEAVTMAYNVHRERRKKVVLCGNIHPEHRDVVRTYTQGMALRLVTTALSDDTLQEAYAQVDEDTACLVVQTPDFFGQVHDLTPAVEAAHAKGALLVVSSYPIALGMYKPGGAYGAEIMVGEGQALGNALSFGGPYLGYFTCKQEYIRKMAGRLVGETSDAAGRRGYVLTLSTREQHIRRERATSNICTNQGLNALAAAVYLVALGKQGLRQVAELCYHKAHYTADRISGLFGYSVNQNLPFFNEFVVTCPRPAREVNNYIYDKFGIIGGYDLGSLDKCMENRMLICLTELNTAAQIEGLLDGLKEAAQ